MTVDGALGHDAVLFLCQLAERLSSCWNKSFLVKLLVELRYDYPLL